MMNYNMKIVILVLIGFGYVNSNVVSSSSNDTTSSLDKLISTPQHNISSSNRSISQGQDVITAVIGDDDEIIPTMKYHSNEFQVSQQMSHMKRHHHNYTDLIRVGDVLNIFGIQDIGKYWTNFQPKLNNNCSTDISDYLDGLENGEMWAIKMDDASGRYTTGFLYGNNYFTGSLSLCTSIYQDDNNINVPLIKKRDNQGGLSLSETFTTAHHSAQYYHENPPFYPGFFVIKILVNETLISQVSRTIYIGICLPTTCTTNEVYQMASQSQDLRNNKYNIEVLSVRSPTQTPYDYWADNTFVILVFVTTCVSILLVTGTLLEMWLTFQLKQKLRQEKRTKEIVTDSSSGIGIGCTTYDLTDSSPNKIDLPIGIVIPHHHSMNNNISDENLSNETAAIGTDEKFGICTELVLSFSIITNFKAICDRTVGSDTIPSIHGLRAISMAWVILGHTCIIVFKYSDNMELRKVVEKEFLFQTITNGAYSVDTFFFISGFLVSYIYFRTNAKGKLEKLTQGVNEITAGTFHFVGLVIYRFIRLTAPYMFVLGVVEVSMKYFEHNSVFEPPTMDHENCPKYWWRNVLYINTLFPVEEMCMLWSWYLADDTQFYIIGAIILIIAVRHFKTASLILVLFMVSSWGTTGYIAFSNNHMPNSDDPLALFDKIYDKPWTRLGPYLIGMSVGWILFKTNCKIKMTRPTFIFGWILSGSCLLYLIYGLYNAELTAFSAAAYSSLSHSAWALSLAWIVVACSAGYGGYINSLLSAPFIYPFSRVTYCAYLVHPIVIRLLALNSDSPLHLGSDSMVITFFGQVVCSYVLSFIVSLSFEAPVVTMLKIMTPNRKKRLV